MIISPCFSSSVIPPPLSRRCPACPGCSVSYSQQRANSSGTMVGPLPQYPVEAKEARQRSLLCRSIGVWQSTAKTHTRTEPNTQHIYMERARKPVSDQFCTASQKERFSYPSISSLFCRHRRHFTSTSLKAQCDKMRYGTAMPTARATKREGDAGGEGRSRKED